LIKGRLAIYTTELSRTPQQLRAPLTTRNLPRAIVSVYCRYEHLQSTFSSCLALGMSFDRVLEACYSGPRMRLSAKGLGKVAEQLPLVLTSSACFFQLDFLQCAASLASTDAKRKGIITIPLPYPTPSSSLICSNPCPRYTAVVLHGVHKSKNLFCRQPTGDSCSL